MYNSANMRLYCTEIPTTFIPRRWLSLSFKHLHPQESLLTLQHLLSEEAGSPQLHHTGRADQTLRRLAIEMGKLAKQQSCIPTWHLNRVFGFKVKIYLLVEFKLMYAIIRSQACTCALFLKNFDCSSFRSSFFQRLKQWRREGLTSKPKQSITMSEYTSFRPKHSYSTFSKRHFFIPPQQRHRPGSKTFFLLLSVAIIVRFCRGTCCTAGYAERTWVVWYG